MKLAIKQINTNQHIDDLYTISLDWLKYKSTHMFIASNLWDKIELQVIDSIDPETVKYLNLVCTNIVISIFMLSFISYNPSTKQLRN